MFSYASTFNQNLAAWNEPDAFVLWQNGTPLEGSSIWNVDEIGWNIEMDKQMILFRTNSKSTNTLNFNRGEHMRACCATTPEGVKTAMPVFYLLSQHHEGASHTVG
jgi:hypothetical protein